MKANSIFTSESKAEIVKAIEQAETKTSGEIRLHVDDFCKGDVLDRAATIFEKLQMHKTQLRNGVLFYVAIENRKFAVIGDAGINQKVPPHFWDDIKNIVIQSFKAENYVQGLVEGIQKAGQQLQTHFPYHKGDVNELNNEISFGNE